MNILIVGSEGFIGNHLVSYFLKNGHYVFGLDLLDKKNTPYSYYKVSRLKPDFASYIQELEFEICINAAGNGSVPLSISNPQNDFEANTIDTFNLLEAIRRRRLKSKFINISSAAVYGNPDSLPIKETHPIKPLSPYGFHKYYSELLCKEYHSLYQIQTCSIRPFSVYGPGLRKQLFWDLYQKIQVSNRINLFGTGNETRDFLYIHDLVQAVSCIINHALFEGEVYNVASGKQTTIREAANIFLSLWGKAYELGFNQIQKEGDPLYWQANIDALAAYGFRPSVSLHEGLHHTVNWMKHEA